MPITVLVRSGTSTPQGDGLSLTFDGARVAIGRSDGCDVRVPDPSVSLRHATIRSQGADYAIVDEGSTNGTWVGGVRLTPMTPRLVRSGDLVRVGRVWLEISVGQRAPTPDLGLATRELALSLVRRAMDAAGDDTLAKVRVTEGPDMGMELRLHEEGRAYLIGRADKCDLPLADEDASREHAVLVRRGSQVMLRDLGSRNGVFLGDMKLSPHREVVWKPPVMARVGVSVLALEEPVSLALADLEAAPDEVLREAELVPEPSANASNPAPEPPPPASAAPPPESRHAAEAPIAEVAARVAPTVKRAVQRRVWTAADIAVVTIAVAVIGASIAGLVWVLR